ncbi:hypothetical protein [Tunicatimonas pelagia]|uniref:hypothetical protein n=1 Tax=Tunicatimonas pelagia TaxID=931531 RepID=UPI0026667E5A|nr:hypothetical protein [Tunicatimonas pelagia]WKN42894.1 hypothetical protein P0M28_28045 [Tunicatimonas pelagia]
MLSRAFRLGMLILTTASCQNPPSSNISGMWFGSYVNETYRLPYPVLLDIRDDGTLTKVVVGDSLITQQLDWKLQAGDTSILQLDTTSYAVLSLSADQLKLHDTNDRIFHRLDSAVTNVSAVQKHLLANIWLREKTTPDDPFLTKSYYRYTADSIYLLRELWYDQMLVGREYEQYSYQFASYRNHLFQVVCLDTPCDFYTMQTSQIIESTDRYLVTQDKREPISPISIYLAVDTTLRFQTESEALRFDACYQEAFTPQYFSVDTDYTGGQRAINQFVNDRYIAPNEAQGQSGYIRIRFTVNCQGKSGRFHVQTSDLAYQPSTFHPDIVRQLLTIVQQLDQWIPGQYDNSDQTADSYKFIGFRMIDGQITQIIP